MTSMYSANDHEVQQLFLGIGIMLHEHYARLNTNYY